ncbi:MAG TPA: TadE/TadG family type IV pilus assembly protein [Sphingomicrobium sp.]|nr:TadE/TadG family type IV pilus assembly protein [Sphingomicrobium sp.]
MSMFKRLRRDQQGAAVIEFAIALPVLLIMIYGIFQVGLIFQANAGMQHALGEGARLATLCTPNGTACTSPSDSAIVAKMSAKKFGMNIGTFGTPTVTTPATSVCTHCRDLTVTYTVTPNYLFFNGPPITLTRSKRVYLAY